MGLSIYPVPSAASRFERTDRITGTQSWTAPADVTRVEVIMCGGGGGGTGPGGSGQGGNGGGGSVDYNVLTVTPGTAYTITIGGGGGGDPANGGQGGTSSFGALWSVVGGFGAVRGQQGGRAAGLGGSGIPVTNNSTGTINLMAYPSPGAFGLGGGGSFNLSSNNLSGAATNGGGVPTSNQTVTAGTANTGGGGSGGFWNGNSIAGGAGGSGVAIIKYWSAL